MLEANVVPVLCPRGGRVMKHLGFLPAICLGSLVAAATRSAWGASTDVPEASAVPRLDEVRAIQDTYSPSGGQLVVEWTVSGGAFDHFVVTVGKWSQPFAGRETGART